MRTVLRAWLPALVALVLFAASADAADKIRVVATITDLKALTDVVGGDLVDVDALARGNQNAHDLEVRPSLMVKVRRADLLVMNGLELDQWAVQPYLSFMPSEFLRFRIGYKHTQGDTPGCCTNTGVGSARIKDELFFQSTFIMGAHPAHPF